MEVVPSTHKLLIGGPRIKFCFQFGRLCSHEDHNIKSPATEIQGSQEPSSIDFRRGSSVSDWSPIYEKFRDSLSSPGVEFKWASTPCIHIRWRLAWI